MGFYLFTTLSVFGETEYVQEKKFSVQSQMSTLWTATTLNWIFADVLSIYQTNNADMEEFAQKKNVEEMMLMGALTIQVPISMIFLSKVLPYRVNRWTNIIAPPVCAAFIIAGRSEEPSYYACAAAECIWLTTISLLALKWRVPRFAQKLEKMNNVRFNFNYDKKIYNLKYTYNFGE